MSERATGLSRAIRLVSALRGGWEPAPAEFVARRSYYPWIVVGTTCIGAFIGQLDASSRRSRFVKSLSLSPCRPRDNTR